MFALASQMHMFRKEKLGRNDRGEIHEKANYMSTQIIRSIGKDKKQKCGIHKEFIEIL
jgi:hypothetical protein